MKTALPTNMRLSFEEARREKLLRLMKNTRLKAPTIIDHFVTAVLDAMPEDQDTITFPIKVEIKGQSAGKAEAA